MEKTEGARRLSTSTIRLIFFFSSLLVLAIVLKILAGESREQVNGQDPGGLSNISVCIPAIPSDWKAGSLRRCLKSIQRQTLQPFSVIVAISEATDGVANAIHDEYSSFLSPVPLIITHTEGVALAGPNRNAAAYVATSSILTFIDADDVMHPQRIEILSEAFRLNPELELLMHAYSAEEAILNTVLHVDDSKVMYAQELCELERTTRSAHLWLHVRMHHAQPTVKSSVFRKFWYGNEYRIEDSTLVRKMVASLACNKNTSVMFYDLPLSWYVDRAKQRHIPPPG